MNFVTSLLSIMDLYSVNIGIGLTLLFAIILITLFKEKVVDIHQDKYFCVSFGLGTLVNLYGFLYNQYVLTIFGVVPILCLILLLKNKYNNEYGSQKSRKSGKFFGLFRKNIKEKKIINKVNEILKREKLLQKQEMKLRKELQGVYLKADQLAKREAIVEDRRSNLNGHANSLADKDLQLVLKITDTLLEKLPDEEIQKFANSSEFETYKKVMERYNGAS